MRTVENFKEAINGIEYATLLVHHCSLCNYPCGFIINDGKLYYDSGCDCVNYNNTSPREVEELFAMYERNPSMQESIHTFLGFKQGAQHDTL